MSTNLLSFSLKRNFIPIDLKIESWNSLEIYYKDLLERKIEYVNDLEKWLLDRSELDSITSEELAWRYIRMNCNTTDAKLSELFEIYIRDIEPHILDFSNELDKKLISCSFVKDLDSKKYFVTLRSIQKKIEIFRKENLPLIADLQSLEQEYGKINAAMTIQYDNKEQTLQQASNYLKNIDRKVREEVFIAINERRAKDIEVLNDLLTKLIDKRQQLAKNAGFANFRDYKFVDMGRFDYSIEDCIKFHESIANEVCPILDEVYKKRSKTLNINNLRPWDLQVDPDLKEPLKPFDTIEELIEKTIQCFSSIKPQWGDFIRIMHQMKHLDLDSRKGKAPGGFNYPLYESNVSFIFMNATHNLRDLETMMHEGGHAIHAFLCKDLELVDFKSTPSEVAELASMSMELISMEHWDIFFSNKEDLIRAKRNQLEGVLTVLPWVATIDKFQQWLYLNENHSIAQRMDAWIKIASEFDSKLINWKQYEHFFAANWQKQLHIYEVPFYYIEYGISQLGAIAIWKNYKENSTKALANFENALKLGYSVTIPEIYKTAGIEFNFSQDYVKQLMNFVKIELEKLY